MMPASISRLWSLQTLFVDTNHLTLPNVVWQMPQLRHIRARRISLPPPDAPRDGLKITILENLQTFSIVEDFKCTENNSKRIPNVKKLGITCLTTWNLSNIGLFHKLESLGLAFAYGAVGDNMVFPSSLKKLTLSGCEIPWKDMSIVGSLPNLEVLKLREDAFVGKELISNEGEFIRLKFLLIHLCKLEIWKADNTHFPCLEQLHLAYMSLKEIPVDFAEILSLQVINLKKCYNISLLESAKEISEKRENLGYEGLQVRNFVSVMLNILVKRGINLALRGAGSRNPYVVVRMGKQRLKTRVIRKDINHQWKQELSVDVSDPNLPVSLICRSAVLDKITKITCFSPCLGGWTHVHECEAVYDKNTSGVDEMLGDAEFDIRSIIEAVSMHPGGLPDGTIITRNTACNVQLPG